MSKDLMFTLLDRASDGHGILSILDALCSGMDGSESSEDNGPTLDEIEF